MEKFYVMKIQSQNIVQSKGSLGINPWKGGEAKHNECY
jgi:hypothetical protein